MTVRRRTRWVVGTTATLMALAVVGTPAHASASGAAARAGATDDEAARQLAERYAPVVRLQQDEPDCEEGEHFQPTDVEAVLGDQQVALRGPWEPPDLVKLQPEGPDVGLGYPGHYLDFPGDPLRPGCTYVEWSKLIDKKFPVTVYAHVAKDPKYPDQLSLQYWFFYVFNDYNNTHEGDWESIQLTFDAPSAPEALETEPTAIGYSQHGGAERALWGDDKLEIVDGTHPVVYPAAGSHANKFGPALYLGRGSEGLGCDDTTDPRAGILARVAFVPGATEDYEAAFPWLAFQGRWGERQRSVFDGPTGPNMKGSWTQPIQDAERTWRDDSTTVPAGTLLGPSSTGVFCSAVATGSNLVRESLEEPWRLILILAVAAVLVWFAASRTRWGDADPLPARRRRGWGQCLVSAVRLFTSRPLLFTGFALAFAALSLGTLTLAWFQSAERDAPADLAAPTDEMPGFWVGLTALAVTILTVVIYVAMLAALAHTLDQLDRGRSVSALGALREIAARAKPLTAVVVWYYLVLLVLTLLVATIPLAIYYAVSRSFAVPVVVTEDRSAYGAMRRSRELVKGHWWRTAVALAIVVGLGISAGPLLGIVLLLGTDWPAYTINLLSSLLFAVAMPLAALAVVYLAFDRAEAVDPDPEARRDASNPAVPAR